MSQVGSEKASASSLYDVAACFSEEEWRMLHEWQKDLYKNVMKEIHQALVSLGPLIVTTVFSLKSKEIEESCHMNSLDSQRRPSSDCSQNYPMTNPDVLLRISREEQINLINAEDSNVRERHSCLGAGDALVNPDALYRMNRGDQVYLINAEDPEGRGRNDCFSKGLPFNNPGMCLRKEESASMFNDDLAEDVGESSTNPSSGEVMNTPVISFRIKDEEETFSLDHPNIKRAESVCRLSDNESMKKEWKEGDLEKCAKRKAPRRARSGKVKMKLVQNSAEETNCRSPFWSRNEREITEGDNITMGETSSSYPLQSVLHQNNQQAEMPAYTEFESNLSNADIEYHHNAEKKTRYACAICRKSFTAKTSVVRHQRTHTGERPFQCPECKKRFIQSGDLIRHRRSHSGERPYNCHECGKSFSQKWHLGSHLRMHGTYFQNKANLEVPI